MSGNLSKWKKKLRLKQRSFKSEMESAPYKCLFRKANDSIVKLMFSITSGVSLGYNFAVIIC